MGAVLTFKHSLLARLVFPYRSAHRHVMDSEMLPDLCHRIRARPVSQCHRLISFRVAGTVFAQKGKAANWDGGIK